MSSEDYIYEAIRTPRGKNKGGALHGTKPVDLVVGLIEELKVRHPNLDPAVIDDIVLGAPLYSRVVVVGVCMEPDSFTPAMAINKELSLQFVFAYDPGEYHDTLRMLTSGKVDRKALKIAPLTVASADGEQEPPANETEAALVAAAKQVFGNQPIPLEGDFFADLGGHSLLAARFVSAVREAPAR